MISHRAGAFRLAILCVPLAAGSCASPQRTPVFRPMEEAVALVERNRRALPPALRAQGSARGHFVDADGKRRHFDLDAKLLVLPPDHLRFALAHVLGGDELRAGINAEKWWIWVGRPQAHEYEGLRGEGAVVIAGTIPVRPEQLMQASGLAPIEMTQAAQRITETHQELIYTVPGPDRRTIEMEIWIDRYEPWLIDRVIFRDAEGRETLSSQLSRYQTLSHTMAMLPREIHLRWPDRDAEMIYRVDRWQADDTLTPDHPITIAMTRALCETLALPRICLSRQCRRMNACKGDAQACLAVGEAMLAPDVVDGARNFLAGQIEGLSFDQVVASGVEQMEAYAQWIERVAPTLPELKRRLGAR